MRFKAVNISDISIFIKEAKKSDLVFAENTKLFGAYDNGLLVGFTGILFYKNKAIFKNHFVPKTYRGKGYFKEMLDFSIMLCKKKGLNTVEATCTNMSIKEYIKRGFKVIKQYQTFTKVRNENI